MVDKMYESLKRKIHGMAARCVLTLVSDGLKMQAVQINLLADETADDVERFQNYGLTSVPLPGAEGVCLFLAGAREHGVVIAMDDRRYRLKGLKGGEVALYTDEGDSLIFKRGKILEATTSTFNLNATTAVNIASPVVNIAALSGVNIQTPALTLTNTSGGAATASFTGTLATTGDVIAAGVSLDGHAHTKVEPGSGTSGAPVGGA
jgi:phage baseplate assembly protein V